MIETNDHHAKHPRALESPLRALQLVEEAAADRFETGAGPWPTALPGQVAGMMRDNHRINADLLAQIPGDEETIVVEENRTLERLQDHLLRARPVTALAEVTLADLERLERSLVAAYELATATSSPHLTTHAKRLLRSGNHIRAAQNLRVLTCYYGTSSTDRTTSPNHAQDVRRSSVGSFPASDAPSWTGTHM